jgi:hypothetical protein
MLKSRFRSLPWSFLAVIIVLATMVNTGGASNPSTIYVDPPLISNLDLSIEFFTINIKVENIHDLYRYTLWLSYSEYCPCGLTTTLDIPADGIEEGDFFKDHPGYSPEEFTYAEQEYCTYVAISFTLTGEYPGVSGSGTLASITFRVKEAGERPLRLIKVELFNSAGTPFRAEHIEHGFYDGPIVKLVQCKTGPNKMRPGMTQTFEVKVRNEGDVTLWTSAYIRNWDLHGQVWLMWVGEEYRPPPPPVLLYVDGFTSSGWAEDWITVGMEPWLDAVGDGSYLEAPAGFDGAMHAWFTFEDLDAIPEGYVIDQVTLEGFTEGPYNEMVDFDVYTQEFWWIGSLYATGEPAWVKPRWSDGSVNVYTKDALNSLRVLVYLYDPISACVPDNIVDCLRLKVEFVQPSGPPPFEPIQPGEVKQLPPVTWTLQEEDIGLYRANVQVWCFAYEESHRWVQAPESKTWTWKVGP